MVDSMFQPILVIDRRFARQPALWLYGFPLKFKLKVIGTPLTKPCFSLEDPHLASGI